MVDVLLIFVQWIGDFLAGFFSFLVQPITWLLQLLDGVFYFLYRLALLLVDLLAVALAFFQLVVAVAAGLIRTVTRFLAWSGSPLQTSVGGDGIYIFSQALEPLGLNYVLPYLLIALDIFATAYLVMWLVGGRKS